MLRRVLFTFMTCFALLAAVFISSPKTFAATLHTNAALAACSGASCNGKDPYTTHCADTSDVNHPLRAQSLYDYSGNLAGTLYNLYSTGCNANWAQVWFNTTHLAVGLSINNPSFTRSYCWPVGCTFTGTVQGNNGAWTDMIDGTPVNTAQVGTSSFTLVGLPR